MGRDFKKLDIWQKSFDFVVNLYPLIISLPDFEDKNLMSQARRAATSIPLNIAEGCSMRSNKVFLNHLNIAYGSAKELEVILLLIERIHDLPITDIMAELDVVKKMIYGLMRSVEREILIGKPNFSAAHGQLSF